MQLFLVPSLSNCRPKLSKSIGANKTRPSYQKSNIQSQFKLQYVQKSVSRILPWVIFPPHEKICTNFQSLEGKAAAPWIAQNVSSQSNSRLKVCDGGRFCEKSKLSISGNTKQSKEGKRGAGMLVYKELTKSSSLRSWYIYKVPFNVHSCNWPLPQCPY